MLVSLTFHNGVVIMLYGMNREYTFYCEYKSVVLSYAIYWFFYLSYFKLMKKLIVLKI